MPDLIATHRETTSRRESPRLSSGSLIALGSAVLVGWWLGIDVLTRVFPGMITMKPNAALGFLLSGLALWSIRGRRPAGRISIGLSMAVATIGGLTLFEYGAGINLGIDELLHREPGRSFGELVRGRMHPTTALNFLVLGSASALIGADREHRAAQALTLLAALIAGSTLIGYLYGVRSFEGLAAFNQMALHTTIGMLVLSIGLLRASSDRGLMIPITEEGPGGLLFRWLLPVAILTPLIISGLTLWARNIGLFEEKYASAVRVTLVIAIFVGCIWRASHSLCRIDRERHRLDAERVEGERRFRFLAEAMPQIVWISRADGEIEYLNQRWFDYTGLDPDRGGEWHQVMHPDDLGPCVERRTRCFETGEVFQGEYRLRRHDGSYRWHLSRAESMRDPTGQIVQWVGTSTDINAQKRAERAALPIAGRGDLGHRLEHPGVRGRSRSEQPGWGAFTGQSFDELQGLGLGSTRSIPEDRARDGPRIWSAAVEESVHLPGDAPAPTGATAQYRHMLVRAVPLLDEDGSDPSSGSASTPTSTTRSGRTTRCARPRRRPRPPPAPRRSSSRT